MKDFYRSIAGVLVGVLAFFIICKCLDYVYVEDDEWNRILFHSYYNQDNIDNIFLGSSHIYCSINPEILNHVSGKNNFNLATSGQRWDESYYLLKDALERYDVKNVYMECFYNQLTEGEAWVQEDNQYEYLDYIDIPGNIHRPWATTFDMKFSKNEIELLVESSSPNTIMETVFPFVRFRANIFDTEYISSNITKKKSDDFKAYKYVAKYNDYDDAEWLMEYKDKGYCYSNGKLFDEEKIMYQGRNFQLNSQFGTKSEAYFEKAIQLCKKKNVNVKLFVAPVNDLELLSTEDYDIYHSKLQTIADELDVDLYDFNLIKDCYLNMNDGSKFLELDHLNNKGATEFTSILAETMKLSSEDTANMFYSTYREKLQTRVPQIYGVYYRYDSSDTSENQLGKPSEDIKVMKIASNRNMNYSVYKRVIDEHGIMQDEQLIDLDESDTFRLPSNETGLLMIDGVYSEGKCSITVKY